MKTLVEIKEILEATGMPVAYSHFIETSTDALPSPPYLVYLVTFSDNFMADNKVYEEIQNVNIELYTDRKDKTVEAIVEAALNDNELPFQSTEAFIESENLFQKIYEVRLL